MIPADAPPDIWKRCARPAVVGLLAAVLVAAAGTSLERSRFGATDAAAIARVKDELSERVAASAALLAGVAARVALSRADIRDAPGDPAAARRLFDALRDALPDSATGITVYGAPDVPLAWAGRVTDLPQERIQGPAALFVAPGALGPQLVRVEPLGDRDLRATVVVEQRLGDVPAAVERPDAVIMTASLVPVSLEAPLPTPAPPSPHAIVIAAADGRPLVEAHVAPADLAAARDRWQRGTRAAVLTLVGLTLLLCAVPLVDLQRRSRRARAVAGATLALLGLLTASRLVLHFAVTSAAGVDAAAPADLMLWALFLAAIAWIGLDLAERARLARPRRGPFAPGGGSLVAIALVYLTAGAIGAAWLWAYERFLQTVVGAAPLDLLHFSLHPFGATRLGIGLGLVLLHAGAVWTAALVLRVAAVGWRRTRSRGLQVVATASWAGGVALAVWMLPRLAGPVPLGPLLLALAAAGGIAVVLGRPRGAGRRASQTARLAAMYLVLLVPAFALYPSLLAFTQGAKEHLVAEEYAPHAARLRDDLQDSLSRAREEIDALPSLGAFIAEASDAAFADPAYQIWSKTDLAAARLTSAVELYGRDGRLVSRFALNLPEHAPTTHRAGGCGWDIVEEVSPFGSSERHVLRASRAICERGAEMGAIAVRVMLDYRTLPFIASQSPFVDARTLDRGVSAETEPGRDVEFAVYGWSGVPLYVSGTSAWPLPDAVFARLVESRARFWATIGRADSVFRVYFLNDRGGIYALGYPVLTPFGHLVNLAELATLAFLLYALLLGGSTAFNALTSRPPASGRAMLREIRSSFYRKLFIAFIAAAIVPVSVLAFATRTYFATQLRAGVEEAAVQTATVAERLVEDYATLQQRGTGALQPLDDQIMVLVGRAIDQAVHLFDGPRLVATSERDLYASRQLSVRTPAEVYRAIVLDRLPSFVGEQTGYLIAAAPVRAGGRAGIVAVPQTLRRQDIEQQIDELDRRVWFASVLFMVLGAGLGYWMAERIADPVNRLSRATRRIARGDLDARIAAASSDELGRLVDDFNSMAADLKRQRTELERTQRLEAWADMARQVAHDIKNPLTPIQLSAEHARRVNLDRGRPLSPVLDECVDAILSQVKLLRQIAGEFSGFASSPVARPEPARLPDLIDEVIEPYRTGLAGRIEIDVRSSPDQPEVVLDRMLFARALTNVIENALHAMPGRGTLTITSSVASAGPPPRVQVQVVDTGTGMDPDALAKIFEPYFSTKASGTGLGLTIARRNVELSRGTIAAESQRGVGTTVTLLFPAGTSAT